MCWPPRVFRTLPTACSVNLCPSSMLASPAPNATGNRSRFYTAVNGEAVVVLGRGLAGRREVSLEIDEAARGRGLGRRLLLGARSLIPEGDVVFAQVAPGNAASLRAFLAAGFRPIGSEVLFLTS